MGEFISKSKFDISERKAFTRALIDDIVALEYMLENRLFEDDITRIGAEQELCIVDNQGQPMPTSLELLKILNDTHFTHELAKYNIEINLDPLELKEQCFSDMESRLRAFVSKAREKAKTIGGDIVLSGILPTISKKEVDETYITPIPRYYALNKALRKQKGADFALKIRGVDEVSLNHNSVMFEACNTSFQLHLQVPSHDFISSYNWAQAIAGPILAVCCNSPLLMGRELWKETRIALFQQSLDTRKTSYSLKDQTPRVCFGSGWEVQSVAKIFQSDISKHRILLTKPIDREASVLVKKGVIPKLEALSLHNGTVYRWNRPCYGVSNNKPHLRIENRYLPSGPSIVDEIANFALWIGLMKARPEEFDHMAEVMDFKDAKNNFVKAARYGKESVMVWNGKEIGAVDLMEKILLPLAQTGLERCGIAKTDTENYLGVIKERLHRLSGAQWQIKNLRLLIPESKVDQSLNILTKAMILNQRNDQPVHLWPLIKGQEIITNHTRVREIMSTHLLTLHEKDMAGMALAIMRWNNIHHIPVENDQGELSGLLTWNFMDNLHPELDLDDKTVGEIMLTEIITVSPETSIEHARGLMEKNEIGCLPVIANGDIVGIVSTKDL